MGHLTFLNFLIKIWNIRLYHTYTHISFHTLTLLYSVLYTSPVPSSNHLVIKRFTGFARGKCWRTALTLLTEGEHYNSPLLELWHQRNHIAGTCAMDIILTFKSWFPRSPQLAGWQILEQSKFQTDSLWWVETFSKYCCIHTWKPPSWG